MVRRRILHKRFCHICGSGRTSLNGKGCENWYHPLGKDKPICDKCYDRDFYGPKYRQRLRLTEKYRENALISASKRYRYRDKKITGWLGQRTGFCSRCPNNIHDRTCKKTDMHHALGYFVTFPWFGRIELCNRCHGLIHHSN